MRITSRFQTRSASSIILKLTLNYNKMFEYSQVTLSGAAPIKINNSRQIPLSRIEQFISNFHESHRSKYRFNDWREVAESVRDVQNKHLWLIAVPKKRKLSENSATSRVDHWYLSIMDRLSSTRIAWIACTIIVIVNYTGTALIWGSELDFRVIRHVGNWI